MLLSENKSHSRYESLETWTEWMREKTSNWSNLMLCVVYRGLLSSLLIMETESTSQLERCWRTRLFQETCASWTTETITTKIQPLHWLHVQHVTGRICLCVRQTRVLSFTCPLDDWIKYSGLSNANFPLKTDHRSVVIVTCESELESLSCRFKPICLHFSLCLTQSCHVESRNEVFKWYGSL